jgi:hypothetical protein
MVGFTLPCFAEPRAKLHGVSVFLVRVLNEYRYLKRLLIMNTHRKNTHHNNPQSNCSGKNV